MEQIAIISFMGATIGILLVSWCGLCLLIDKLTKGWLKRNIMKFFTEDD